jgi:hypothetical protein
MFPWIVRNPRLQFYNFYSPFCKRIMMMHWKSSKKKCNDYGENVHFLHSSMKLALEQCQNQRFLHMQTIFCLVKYN